MIGDKFKSDSCIYNEAVYEIILEQQFIYLACSIYHDVTHYYDSFTNILLYVNDVNVTSSCSHKLQNTKTLPNRVHEYLLICSNTIARIFKFQLASGTCR